MTEAARPGVLYLVSTPIGNRQDISIRALDILKTVDFILAEDTRHTLPLLTTYGIKASLVAYHMHNESLKVEEILRRLDSGASCALVSDAGTPLISDPGYPLVKAARDKGLTVVPIPGACALITALSAAGLPCEPFTFLGFMPSKQHARRTLLTDYQSVAHTLVFYESSHRILDTLIDLEYVFGSDLYVVLAKELTKSFETFVPGTVRSVHAWLIEDALRQKGEFVMMIAPRVIEENVMAIDRTLMVLMEVLPLKQAVALTSTITGIGKNQVYERALSKKQQGI